MSKSPLFDEWDQLGIPIDDEAEPDDAEVDANGPDEDE